jgi:hypothetical protein
MAPPFSTIVQDPTIRALVQTGLLERAFHDALFPRLLFRGEAKPVLWPNHVGDSMAFTGVGLIAPKGAPIVPGQDPIPSNYQSEQWTAQLQQYADSIDTNMPSAITAIANLFLRNAMQLGLAAGQSLNRIVRDRLYNAASAGNTVSTSSTSSSTALPVARLAGFTTARRPDLTTGSPVQYQPVSVNNPLNITINGVGSNTVVGFTPNTVGDEQGPGTLTLGAAATVPAARTAVLSTDKTFVVYVGGGIQTDSINSTCLLTLAAIRSAVAQFWQENVPEHPDGLFHMHVDPIAQGQVFSDPEFQRLLTSLPDYFMYSNFALGKILNTAVFRNSECPLPETVYPYDGQTYSTNDQFGAELYSNGNPSTGDRLHRSILTGQGGIMEYYQDLSGLVTEAGVTGKVGAFSIDNNGITVNTDRIQLIIRAPLNRLQDTVSCSYKFIGDWPFRTDVLTGGPQRIKRVCQIVSGE